MNMNMKHSEIIGGYVEFCLLQTCCKMSQLVLLSTSWDHGEFRMLIKKNVCQHDQNVNPIGSMYGIFTYQSHRIHVWYIYKPTFTPKQINRVM